MMKILSGMKLMGDEAPVNGDTVRFVMDDGQTMFEVCIGRDGASIEVRAPDNCKVDGVLHSTMLLILPNVSNQVTIKTSIYD